MASIDKRAIFEGMTRTLPVLAFCVDAQGVFREVIANGYTDDFLYGEPSATIGKSIHELFANEKAEMFNENIHQAIQTGAVQEFEYSLPINEKARTFAGYMAPMEMDTHENHVVWIAEDITERIEQRNERQRQHEHLVNAENLAQMGGWEYRPDNGTLQWTEGTRQIFEVSDDFEPTLSNAINFYYEPDQPIIEDAVEKCLKSGIEYSLDAQVITDEGRQRWIQTTGNRITTNGATKLRGVIQDITQRKGREQRLEVLNRVLRHNLRNELTTVFGFAEELQEQLPAETEDYPSKIIESSERLLALSEKSKKFETAMQYNYITGPVQIESILDELCVEYREKYPNATIQTELRDAQAPGNEMAIELIFEELLGNALKHNDAKHPTVKVIMASPDPNRVKISIIDDGPGLPEMEQQVMQYGEETALQHSGGIGLWTTNWLVHELSGNTRVTATEGGGTSITITIPGDKSE